MTVLKARLECDICGIRRSMSRRKINRWESALEIKRGFKMMPVDICPKCQKADPPKDRVFVRMVPPLDLATDTGSMHERYRA